MFFKQLLQSSTVRLALIALVLCGVTLVGSRSTEDAKAAAMQSTINQQVEQDNNSGTAFVPSTTTEEVFVHCSVLYTGVDPDWVTLHSLDCSPSTGQVVYFRVPASSKMGNQILSIALTAQAIGKQMALVYDSTNNTGFPNVRNIVSMGVDVRHPAGN